MSIVRTTAAALMLLGLVQPARANVGKTKASDIRAIVDAAVRDSGRPRERAASELRALDADSVRAMLEVFSGRDLASPASGDAKPAPPPPDWLPELLLDVLSRFDDRVLTRELSAFASDATMDERLISFGVVDAIDGRGAVDAWFALVDGVPDLQFRRVYVARRVEEALAAALERTPGAMRSLARQVEKLGPVLRPVVVRSIGRAGAWEGMAILRRLFGRERELDLVLLKQSGQLRLGAVDQNADVETRWVQDALVNRDGAYREAAAVALGRLHASHAVSDLIERLDDDEPRVRRRASWALHQLSGNDWESDRERWTAWWTAEREWHAGAFQRELRAMRSTDPAIALAAVDALSRHQVFARRIVVELRTLTSDNAEIERRVRDVIEDMERAFAD